MGPSLRAASTHIPSPSLEDQLEKPCWALYRINSEASVWYIGEQSSGCCSLETDCKLGGSGYCDATSIDRQCQIESYSVLGAVLIELALYCACRAQAVPSPGEVPKAGSESAHGVDAVGVGARCRQVTGA